MDKNSEIIRIEIIRILNENGKTRGTELAKRVMEKVGNEKTVYREISALVESGDIEKRVHSRSHIEYELVNLYESVNNQLKNLHSEVKTIYEEIENFDNPEWGYTEGGMLPIECNYLWVVDNLLDPSHVAWVHVTSFAGSGTDDQPLDLEKTENGVIVSRWIYDQPPSPYYKDLVKFEGNCDRKQHYEMCIPGIALNKSVYTPPGTGGPNKPEGDKTYINISYNFMTPVDERNTMYIWFQHRNTDPEDKLISEKMNAGARAAFLEDKEILEAVQIGMEDMDIPNIDLALDAGAKLFRLKLQRLINEEQNSKTEG